jgi:hypothetical protein
VVVQEVHGVEALLLARSDGTEVAQRWLLTASRADGWRCTGQRQNERGVGEAKCEEDSSGHPRTKIRSPQSDRQQPVASNGGAECGHRW